MESKKVKVTLRKPIPKREKMQMILKPVGDVSCDSMASTVEYIPQNSENPVIDHDNDTLVGEASAAADQESNASSSDSEDEDLPLREDVSINRERWSKQEVKALMDAINTNRPALKYHFSGTGGGRDIRRQAWRDVALYVNQTAKTHRTVKQISHKASDFCQKQKGKYNILRRELSKTGSGPPSKKLTLSNTQKKALDYLREDAVRGIPGVSPMALDPSQVKKEKTGMTERDLWKAGRSDFSEAIKKMKVTKIPKKDMDKEKRKEERKKKEQRKIEHAKKMKEDRKKEKEDLKIREEMKQYSKKKEEERKKSQDHTEKKPWKLERQKKVIVCTKEEWEAICREKAERKAERAAIRESRKAKKEKEEKE